MYQIGEFAKICNTTIKTLRYYDKINLIRPIKVNNYTGYRYYCDEQISLMEKIIKLKQANFTLDEIKQIMETNNNVLILDKIEDIKNESKEKEMILQEFEENMNKNKIKLIKNPRNILVGNVVKIKNRKEIKKQLDLVDKLLWPNLYDKNIFVIENYENEYKDENIKCFIGRKLKDIYSNKPEIISKINNDLIVTDNEKINTMLYTKVKKENIKQAYDDIIEYSLNDNIQIRGDYQEIYNHDSVEIYVEAYDLKVENPDIIQRRNNLKNKLKNIQPEEYIGTWELAYEDNLPNDYKKKMKNNIEYNIPITKYQKFVINKDGTTNYDNIVLKENYLEVIEDNITYYHKLYMPYEDNKKTYLSIMINFKESNARPKVFVYIKK